MKVLAWIVFGPLALFFVLSGIGAMLPHTDDPQADERYNARRGIAYCDSKVKDELAPLSERRMMRDICDNMRTQYKTKYGIAP